MRRHTNQRDDRQQMMFRINSKYGKCFTGNSWMTESFGFNHCSGFIALEVI